MAEHYHITIQPLPNWSLSWINWEVQDTFLIHVLVYLWYQKLITLRHNDFILFSVMWVFVVVALRLLWLFRDCSWGLCDMTPIVWPRHSTGKSNQSLLAGAAAWGRRCSFFVDWGNTFSNILLFAWFYRTHKFNKYRKGRFARKPKNTKHGGEHLYKYHLMSFAE